MIKVALRYWADRSKRVQVTRTRENMFEILKNSSDCLLPVGVRPGDIGPVEICKDLPHGSVVLDQYGKAWTVGRTSLGSRLLRVEIDQHSTMHGASPVYSAHMYSSPELFTQEHLEEQEFQWGSSDAEEFNSLDLIHDSSEWIEGNVIVITVGKACLGDALQG